MNIAIAWSGILKKRNSSWYQKSFGYQKSFVYQKQYTNYSTQKVEVKNI